MPGAYQRDEKSEQEGKGDTKDLEKRFGQLMI